MTQDEKNELIAHLRALGSGVIKPKDTGKGMCHEMDAFTKNSVYCAAIRGEAFKRWPKYSGTRGYPIPGTLFNSPFSQYINTRHKWSKSKYADLRRELCLWVADYLEEHLEAV